MLGPRRRTLHVHPTWLQRCGALLTAVVIFNLTVCGAANSSHGCPTTHLQDNCTCSASHTGIEFSCLHDGFTIRSSISRLAVRISCSAAFADYGFLDKYNFSWGVVANVEMKVCRLPDNFKEFFTGLGVGNVRALKVTGVRQHGDTLTTSNVQDIDLHELTVIDIENTELGPDFFKSMTNLRRLVVTFSHVYLSPTTFSHTPALERLVLSEVGLQNISEVTFQNLSRLKRLSLRGNNISVVSPNLFVGPANLTSLNLESNNLESLPDKVFVNLQNLTDLRLEYNSFVELRNQTFDGLRGLVDLRLGNTRRNQLVSLPSGLFNGLTRLETLSMQRMGLRNVPSTLFDELVSLKNLTIRSNNITGLSPNIFSSLKNLQNIDIRNNPLGSVPIGLLDGLTKLDVLKMNNLSLIELPKNLFKDTKKLRQLFLNNNRLDSLDQYSFAGATSLTEIYASRNQLNQTSWGEAFWSLDKLEVLDVSFNRITNIPDGMRTLIRLRDLNLNGNRLKLLSSEDFNFFCDDGEIHLEKNDIEWIDLKHLVHIANDNVKRAPNLFHLKGNPLLCDCHQLSLMEFLSHTGQFKTSLGKNVYKFMRIVPEHLLCAGPGHLTSRSLSQVSPDELVCPVDLEDGCPRGCVCSFQISTNVLLVECRDLGKTLPSYSSFDNISLPLLQVRLKAENTGLNSISNLRNNSVNITALDLSSNNISSIDASMLPVYLEDLQIDDNNLSRLSDDLLAFFTGESRDAPLTVKLGNNPYVCDCLLVPLLRFLKSDTISGRSRVLDVDGMRCVEDSRSLLNLTERDLCPGSEALVIVLCLVAATMAVSLLVAAVLYYRYGGNIKVWLYAHRLCLWWVSERELDADKKYDVFLSYSHLDEQFVVDKLVRELEQGQPRYSVCLHFRDWLAGEWIANQIERSVQESRRVIVVMSQNFVDSAWGRLEFAAAHKQALQDKTNRLIVVVYGDVPEASCLDADLRLYLTMNTYLKWGDPLFWQRLKYALPHKEKQRLRGRVVNVTADARQLVGENGSNGHTPSMELSTKPNVDNKMSSVKLSVNGISKFQKDRLIENVI